MELNLTSSDGIIFAEKPSGISTHAADQGKAGFVERLSEKLNKKLYVVHRLDKATSGAIIFAEDSLIAKDLGEMFVNSRINKEYLFLTDKYCEKTDLTVQSDITKIKGIYNSDIKSSSPNSETIFRFEGTYQKLFLWRAIPRTGKTHQIRLHAKNLGIPILGDTTYGGTKFVRLMLHAEKLTFLYKEKQFNHYSPLPLLFTDTSFHNSYELALWQHEADQRYKLYKWEQDECLRLIHDKPQTHVCCDLYGNIAWFYWFNDSSSAQNNMENIELFCQKNRIKDWHVSIMINKGSTSKLETPLSSINKDLEWIVKENNMQFILKNNQGSSPGLFLDQKNNRNWVYNNSYKKNVLNLFSYTGSFSVAAAKGNADTVTSVDTSKSSNDWAKRNCEINSLDLNKIIFLTDDARNFLKRAKKQNKIYDLVICDPPSFARSKQKVFSLEKEIYSLLGEIKAILAIDGILLFSTNLEKLSDKDLSEIAESVFPQSKIELCYPDQDCGINYDSARLKTVRISI